MAYNLVKGGDKDKDEKKHGGRTKRQYGGRGPGERTQHEVKRREAVQAATDYGADPRVSESDLRDKTRAFEQSARQTAYKKGGRTKKMNGGPMMGMMPDPRMGMVPSKAFNFSGAQGTPYKKGGKVKAKSFDEIRKEYGTQVMARGGKAHSDEAEDKALIKKMVKPSARTGKASGGEIMKRLGAGRKGSKDVESAEKEYGEREDVLKKAEMRIENEFSPSAMRRMREEMKARREADPEFVKFVERRKKRDADESMQDAGYKKGGRTRRADGGDVGAGSGKRTDRQQNVYEPDYNEESVDKAIKSSRQKIGGKEAAMIKKLLRGREGRATGGKVKKGKTNINIIINAGKKGEDAGMPPMPPGMPGGPMSLQRPPMPPPGMPPMGGHPGMPAGGPPSMGQPPMPPMARKSGGRVSKVAKSYADMEAGAGSGEGRLQKADIAKRNPKPREDGVILTKDRGYPNKVLGATGGRTARKEGGKVYRSYKDMDAGAGSGKGRLEKEEIQKRKH
jgi:hypothetical protein